MKTTTLRILMILLAGTLVLAMAGCKSESSPTAPPSTSTSPPGGVTPPTGASIVLTVSPSNSVTVSSTVTITATVTENGTAVTDGTAVQFTASSGTFADSGSNTTIRTTTGGVATAKLTSAAAATITVTATVNNVSKTTSVTFTTVPATPQPPSTAPTISAVCVQTGSTCTTPATGIPAGGQQVIITGTNFRAPVRVLFDPGNGVPAKEAFVASVTATQIVAVAPPFDITTGQTLPVNIIVFSEAGTTNEQKVSVQNAFTYQLTILTPTIRTVSPTSGPIDGGTRVSIFGDAFQSPVQVFFGSAEAQQLNVTFNQINVISPTARDTNPNGSGTVTGPVEIKVRNIGSGKEATFPAGFRYIAKMQITAINPVAGSANGGTDVTIDGVGFNDPLTVDIAGVRAQVIRVSGTEIVARTGRLPSPCSASAGGPVTVTNVDNGDTAISVVPQVFTYVGILPVIGTITSTTTPPQPGSALTVPVTNPGVGVLGNAIINFTVGGLGANTTPNVISNGAAQTFTVVVPNIPNSAFTSTEACTVSSVPGTRLAPQDFPVVFTNATTGCTTTAIVTIAPLASNNPCVIPPPPTATLTAPASGCANGGSVVAAGSATGTATITITNTGGQTLNIASNPVISGANAGDFTIAPVGARAVAPQGTASYTITFDPSAVGTRNATVTFSTNDPNNASVAVCLTGTGT